MVKGIKGNFHIWGPKNRTNVFHLLRWVRWGRFFTELTFGCVKLGIPVGGPSRVQRGLV